MSKKIGVPEDFWHEHEPILITQASEILSVLQESCVLTLDCFALFLDKLYVFGILALVSEGCAIYFPAKQYMRIHVILVVVVRSNHFLGVSCTLMSVSLGMSAYANPVGNH